MAHIILRALPYRNCLLCGACIRFTHTRTHKILRKRLRFLTRS